MDKSKIPWIECILKLPEQVEDEFTNLLMIYKKKSRSKNKLKKKKCRITTEKLLKHNDETIVEDSTENIDNNINFFDSIEDFINNIKFNKSTNIQEGIIINYLENLIKKYVSVYIHIEDQILLVPEKNKNNDKIYLKFYFPRIKGDNQSDNQNDNENYEIKSIEKKINRYGDNIHFTLLPEIFGHGIDGMFHLTFRIEGKNSKPIYEYSKYMSFNVQDGIFGIILYDDEKGNNSVIFRISKNADNLKKFIKSLMDCVESNILDNGEYYKQLDSNDLNYKAFSDLCLYITYDILKKLIENGKINSFNERYFNSIGKDSINKMINKLVSILLSIFINIFNDNI